jgi:predicted metalloprotease
MANWGKLGSRGQVEDRRSMAPMGIGGLSITGVALLLLLQFMTGGDPADVLNQLENIPVEQQQDRQREEFAGEDSYEVFASTVLGSNNEMWTSVFNRLGRAYTEPRLVLFRSATQSGCGTATAQVGPHYCPYDQTIYLDETFFAELTSRLGAQGGDVAEAYVIAHEVAHHAQNQLGIMNEIHDLQSANADNTNEMSIRLELQADCFAGLWAGTIKDLGVFQPGEIGEAMDAAAAVGDDRIQSKVTGQVNPESWTHGSSEQRVSWFNRGYEGGTLSVCDTFR